MKYINDLFTTGLLGVVLSLLIGFFINAYLPILISYIKNRFQNFSLKGKWYEYHYTIDNSDTPYFSMGEVMIKNSLFASNPAKLKYEKNGQIMRYKGKYFEEEGHVIFEFTYIGKPKVTVYMRFYQLLPDADIMFGINHSYDYSKTIFSCSNILSREQLTENELKSIFNDKSEIYIKHKILRVSTNNFKKRR
jgi:hypothetical protein